MSMVGREVTNIQPITKEPDILSSSGGISPTTALGSGTLDALSSLKFRVGSEDIELIKHCKHVPSTPHHVPCIAQPHITQN